FALDLDGTVAAAGEPIPGIVRVLLRALREQGVTVVAITAQSWDYALHMGATLEVFDVMVTEKGLETRFADDRPDIISQAPVYTQHLEATQALITQIGASNSVKFTMKRAGYAVRLYADGGGETTDEQDAQILALMEQQAASSGGVFVVDVTTNFYDLTLAGLNKEVALQNLKDRGVFGNDPVLAAGNGTTDVPMLRIA
ncbi:unnamed protein product, partial [Ectocarpus sp. 4 AP-2014]